MNPYITCMFILSLSWLLFCIFTLSVFFWNYSNTNKDTKKNCSLPVREIIIADQYAIQVFTGNRVWKRGDWRHTPAPFSRQPCTTLFFSNSWHFVCKNNKINSKNCKGKINDFVWRETPLNVHLIDSCLQLIRMVSRIPHKQAKKILHPMLKFWQIPG